MTDKPLVSVLMTAYNREKYIAEAIESVIASTYQNWELIIVDDVSKDKTVEIAKSYEAKDNRIKVYINEQNLGDYPNRNKAASYAHGKYLKYLDADDLIYPYGLKAMVSAMEIFPASALAITSPKTEELTPYPYQITPEEAYKEHFIGTGFFNCGPTGLIFKTDIFKKENGFSGERYIGDTEFLLRVGAKYPVVKMAPGLAWWRQHDGQEIELGQTSGFYLTNVFNLNLEKLSSEKCPLNEQSKFFALKKQKQHHARRILALAIKQKNISFAYKLFKNSGLSFFELLFGFVKYI